MRIIYVQSPCKRANRECRPLLYPRDGRYRVVCASQVTELRHDGGMCRPEIDGGAKADTKHVRARPVNQVEIKVVG